MIALAVVMCAPPTEIVVDVYSDVPCELRPTPGLAVGRDLADLAAQTVTSVATRCAVEPERVGRIVLRPRGDRNERLALKS